MRERERGKNAVFKKKLWKKNPRKTQQKETKKEEKRKQKATTKYVIRFFCNVQLHTNKTGNEQKTNLQ